MRDGNWTEGEYWEPAWLLEPGLPSQRGCCTASGFQEIGNRDTRVWLCSLWIHTQSGLSRS